MRIDAEEWFEFSDEFPWFPATCGFDQGMKLGPFVELYLCIYFKLSLVVFGRSWNFGGEDCRECCYARRVDGGSDGAFVCVY